MTADQTSTQRRSAPGVYGLKLSGLAPNGLLAAVDSDAPALDVSYTVGHSEGRVEELSDDHAEISLIDDGWVSLSRAGRADFTLPKPVPAEELLHPWLVPAAATFSGWLGRQVLHGGVVARENNAIAVLGDKEAGKSSLLAWLAATGDFEILADDLVIVEAGEVLPGPRCIDLRSGSIGQIPIPDPGRLVRNESRIRLELPPCRDRAGLVGIVILGWNESDRAAVETLGPSEALSALLPHALGGLALGRGHLLDLLDLPVTLLSRPRRWSIMPSVEEAMAALLV